jgi:protein-S-isoprenylcysteine O-methyltransferase Ste14
MDHLLPREIAPAVFLLLLGAARVHFLAAVAQSAERLRPVAHWARHVPAYTASSAWAIYVAWLVVAPAQLVAWDRWFAGSDLADLLGWLAVPFLVAGLGLFWYGHAVIGHYWSIRIRLKAAHRLVTDGPYRLVRHPLYSALFLGYLGTLLALQSWVLTAWFPVFVASYLVFAHKEEDIMERGFGEAYRAYRRQTGMFIPKWAGMRAGLAHATRSWRTRDLDSQVPQNSDQQ